MIITTKRVLIEAHCIRIINKIILVYRESVTWKRSCDFGWERINTIDTIDNSSMVSILIIIPPDISLH